MTFISELSCKIKCAEKNPPPNTLELELNPVITYLCKHSSLMRGGHEKCIQEWMSTDSGIASLTFKNHAWKCEIFRTQEALSGCRASRSLSGTLIQENTTCMLVKG